MHTNTHIQEIHTHKRTYTYVHLLMNLEQESDLYIQATLKLVSVWNS